MIRRAHSIGHVPLCTFGGAVPSRTHAVRGSWNQSADPGPLNEYIARVAAVIPVPGRRLQHDVAARQAFDEIVAEAAAGLLAAGEIDGLSLHRALLAELIGAADPVRIALIRTATRLAQPGVGIPRACPGPRP